MIRDERNDLLAGYLGDELPPADRQRFEDFMAADPAFAEEVAALRHTLVTLRSLDEPVGAVSDRDAASRRVYPGADEGGIGSRTPGNRRRAHSRIASPLRYAAAILLAFAAGYAAKSFSPAAAPPALTEPRPNQPKPSPDFERRFAEAYGRSSADSELARSLIALSRATH